MPLPSRTIEAIFTRLLVRYGSAWLRKWEALPNMDGVKADWANELGGLSGAAIAYALDHLPTDFPPDVTAFRALAANRPEYFKALAAPKADPVRVAEILATLKLHGGGDRFDWAYALQEREKNGEDLTETQRALWRRALELAPVDFAGGQFTSPSAETLPPGMRPDAYAAQGPA